MYVALVRVLTVCGRDSHFITLVFLKVGYLLYGLNENGYSLASSLALSLTLFCWLLFIYIFIRSHTINNCTAMNLTFSLEYLPL